MTSVRPAAIMSLNIFKTFAFVNGKQCVYCEVVPQLEVYATMSQLTSILSRRFLQSKTVRMKGRAACDITELHELLAVRTSASF